MKQMYESPEMEIIVFNAEDVIVTSCPPDQETEEIPVS